LIPSRGNDGIFSLCHHVQTGSGAHPTSYPLGSGALTPGVKQLGHEADHSSHLVPRLRMCGAIPTLPQYIMMCLIKQRENITFTMIKV